MYAVLASGLCMCSVMYLFLMNWFDIILLILDFADAFWEVRFFPDPPG